MFQSDRKRLADQGLPDVCDLCFRYYVSRFSTKIK